MGGDDLGSDDERYYASDHSSDSNEPHGAESDSEERVVDTKSTKRKTIGTPLEPSSKKKKPKKSSEESSIANISRQSASEQAVFLSKEIAKYVSSMDQRPNALELKPGDLATSKKETLLQRLTEIVAQSKIRKWKHKLSPCVIIICVSARRAVHVLKEIAPIKARAAKLFPKNGSISEQLKELIDAPFGIAVGTPHRIQALCQGEDSTTLSLRQTQLIVFDSHLNDKRFSVLTLPDTVPCCMDFLVRTIGPELRQRKDLRIALL